MYSIVYIVFFFSVSTFNLFNLSRTNGHLGCFQAYAIEDVSAYTCLYCFAEMCRYSYIIIYSKWKCWVKVMFFYRFDRNRHIVLKRSKPIYISTNVVYSYIQ